MSAVLTYRFFPSYLKVIRMSASTFVGPLGKNPNLKAKLKAKIQMARGVKIDNKIDNKVEERKRRLSGRAGREHIWLEVMPYGPSAARCVRVHHCGGFSSVSPLLIPSILYLLWDLSSA